MPTRFQHGITAGPATSVVPAPAAITATTAPAGGTGAAEGGWDTAADRDLAIASLTSSIADLTALRTKVADILVAVKASGLIPPSAVAAPDAITAQNPPAAGVGAEAGAYDTAGHRDAMIASLTASQVDIVSLRNTVASLLIALQGLGVVA